LIRRWHLTTCEIVFAIAGAFGVLADQGLGLSLDERGLEISLPLLGGERGPPEHRSIHMTDPARRLARLPKAMVKDIAPENWIMVPALRGIAASGP